MLQFHLEFRDHYLEITVGGSYCFAFVEAQILMVIVTLVLTWIKTKLSSVNLPPDAASRADWLDSDYSLYWNLLLNDDLDPEEVWVV